MDRQTAFQWARLVRLPNTPTVVADVLAGFTLAAGQWDRPIVVSLAIASVIALYWSGMIWNDVADVEQDSRERPDRPIPSGKISQSAARLGAMTTLAIGIAVAVTVDLVGNGNSMASGFPFPATLVAVILSACMLLYDLVAKQTVFAPWLMGGCRAAAMLLGAAAAGFFYQSSHLPFYSIVIAVLGHGIYVAGFTLSGRKEAASSERNELLVGWLICGLGIVLLASVDWSVIVLSDESDVRRVQSAFIYPALIAALSLPLLRRAVKSIRTGAGLDIQAAIKQAIFSIIFFDAAIALQFGTTFQAIAIASLIIPTLLIAKWFYST